MIYYKPVKVNINTLKLVRVIFNMIIKYYSLLDLIIINRDLLLNFKF